VPTDSLPDKPDLQRLKGEAKALRDRVRASEHASVEVVRRHHPKFADLAPGTPEAAGFKLAGAQLTLARRYGYASWPRLRRYVELVNRLSRSPHEQPVGGELEDDAARADEFLRLACLNYGADDPGRWRDAARLLAVHPHLARATIHTAAAVGDPDAAAEILATDPAAASQEGGSFAWEPLLYLTYSRLHLADTPQDHLAVARLLVEAGADPNAGFLWDGLPSPFTALTGVFGRGEQGAPPHRDELALARLLLGAGAEANDSQTIYNRGAGDIARDDTEFLELLLDFGLGHGDGGPWRRRLMDAHQTPTEIVGEALQHATEADLVNRARLLLARGADPDGGGTHPGYEGRSPYESAVLFGNHEIADLLASAGADTSTVDPLSRFIGLCLAGDRAGVQEALVVDADLFQRARTQRADLVARAAELNRPDAVRLLAELGFDVNTRHRTTALHEAALRGNLPMVRFLIELGADPAIVDCSYDSTPRGWAEHNGQTDVVAFFDILRPPV
jgi:ankyrin repeat protein